LGRERREKLAPQEIRAQLHRIRSSSAFESHGLGRTLEFVVEEALAGRGDRIDDYSVGVKGLGFPPDFTPSTNPAVRVLLKYTRQALKAYYGDQGVKDPIRIEIPPGSCTPSFSPNL
jgi:adenylate cyclase